jgi:hypothetical protein
MRYGADNMTDNMTGNMTVQLQLSLYKPRKHMVGSEDTAPLILNLGTKYR